MIYFIQSGDNGPVKIGQSTNVASRLKCLQSASPNKLKLLYCHESDKFSEPMIRHLFNEILIRGEWFQPSKEIFDCIENLKAGNGSSYIKKKNKPKKLRNMKNGMEFNRERVKKEISNLNIKEAELAKRMGVHRQYLNRIMVGDMGVSLKGIDRIANALGLTGKDLIR